MQHEVEIVSSVMRENVTSLIDRGVRVDDMESRSDNMLREAQTFKASTTALKNHMWWVNMRLKLALGFMLFIILLIIWLNLPGRSKGE